MLDRVQLCRVLHNFLFLFLLLRSLLLLGLIFIFEHYILFLVFNLLAIVEYCNELENVEMDKLTNFSYFILSHHQQRDVLVFAQLVDVKKFKQIRACQLTLQT